jgi:hypothetical protein
MIIILVWKSSLLHPSCPAPLQRRWNAPARVAPVVILLGARQTGKTTLVRSMPLLAGRPYLTLDDFDLRMQAEADPESVVARAPALILDEVQRARDLLIAIQRAVDREPARTPGRAYWPGSADSHLAPSTVESVRDHRDHRDHRVRRAYQAGAQYPPSPHGRDIAVVERHFDDLTGMALAGRPVTIRQRKGYL